MLVVAESLEAVPSEQHPLARVSGEMKNVYLNVFSTYFNLVGLSASADYKEKLLQAQKEGSALPLQDMFPLLEFLNKLFAFFLTIKELDAKNLVLTSDLEGIEGYLQMFGTIFGVKILDFLAEHLQKNSGTIRAAKSV